jgi:hypothetical protein
MARRGRKRRLELEAEYWRLLAARGGQCRGVQAPWDRAQDGLPVAGGERWPATGLAPAGISKARAPKGQCVF